MRVYRLDKDEAEYRAALIIGEFKRNCRVITELNDAFVKAYIIAQFLQVMADCKKGGEE